MKFQTTKRLFTLPVVVVLLASLFVFNINCKKEIKTDIKEANSINASAIDLAKAGTLAKSSIIYTDVKPDSTINSYTGTQTNFYNLDLDNNGTIDFAFEIYYKAKYRNNGPDYYVKIESASGNEVAVKNGALAFDTLAVIDSTHEKWSGGGYKTLAEYDGYCSDFGCSGSYTGNWAPIVNNKYLGLQLIKGSKIYYAWARLSVSVFGSAAMTIKDYAYNSIPNQSILAGQTK